MKKIRLNLDALAVETFATTQDDGRKRGTVRGHNSGWFECDTDSNYPLCACQPQPISVHGGC